MEIVLNECDKKNLLQYQDEGRKGDSMYKVLP